MIGVFDSGFGGLTVLRALLDHPACAQHEYRYLGDSLHAPYGDKTHEEIFEYTARGVTFLFEEGCALVIIACNSASAKALRRLQQEWLPTHYPDRRVLGVIRPTAEAVAARPAYRRIGILATPATVDSNVYAAEIHKLRPDAKVIQQAAPRLAPLIERGETDTAEMTTVLQEGLKPLLRQSIDVLIPACTHYPLVRSELQSLLPATCDLLDTGNIVADSLHRYLVRHPELDVTPTAKPTVEYYTTGDAERFRELGERFLGEGIEKVRTVTI